MHSRTLLTKLLEQLHRARRAWKCNSTQLRLKLFRGFKGHCIHCNWMIRVRHLQRHRCKESGSLACPAHPDFSITAPFSAPALDSERWISEHNSFDCLSTVCFPDSSRQAEPKQSATCG